MAAILTLCGESQFKGRGLVVSGALPSSGACGSPGADATGVLAHVRLARVQQTQLEGERLLACHGHQARVQASAVAGARRERAVDVQRADHDTALGSGGGSGGQVGWRGRVVPGDSEAAIAQVRHVGHATFQLGGVAGKTRRSQGREDHAEVCVCGVEVGRDRRVDISTLASTIIWQNRATMKFMAKASRGDIGAQKNRIVHKKKGLLISIRQKKAIPQHISLFIFKNQHRGESYFIMMH